jgi:hypothetical protein
MKNGVFWDVAPLVLIISRLIARVISSTLKMGATRSFETSVYNKPTRRHIPEYGILHEKCCSQLCTYSSFKTMILGVREKHLTLIKTKHGKEKNLESALILTLRNIRPQTEVLTCQKEAHSSRKQVRTTLIIYKILAVPGHALLWLLLDPSADDDCL